MESVVLQNVDRPIFFCYTCDGWSSFVDSRSSKRQAEVLVRRCGRHREEYLLQRGVLRTLSASDGGSQVVHLIVPPRPLRRGRGSWNVFVAAGECWGTLRSLGHRGISVTVYLQDGALHESSLRKFRGKHEVWYDVDICPVDAPERDILYNSEWVFGLQCKAHSCSNGLKWGLVSDVTASEVEDAHIVVQSLINSSMSLHSMMDVFLQQHLVFREDDDDLQSITDFWEFLDVHDPGMLALLAEVDPMWEGGRLRVRSDLQHDPECWSKVSVCIAFCWRWLSWSDTRWVRAGRSARYYLRSLAAGIAGQAALCLSDPHVSSYHLKGHNSSTVAIKRFSPSVRSPPSLQSESSRTTGCFGEQRR